MDSWPPPHAQKLCRRRTMKRLRTPNPDLFKTSRYELPSPQQKTAVEMLKMLLVEVMMMPIAASNTSDESDNRELSDAQHHGCAARTQRHRLHSPIKIVSGRKQSREPATSICTCRAWSSARLERRSSH